MSVVDLVNNQEWGHMVALRGTDINTVDFSEALGALKTVPPERYDAAAMLFG
jgi:6-phosphofructokinase 1